MAKKFLRSDGFRHSRLGKGRKKLQKWRNPAGRDNKVGEKRHGHPASPTVGHRSPKKESGRIKGLLPRVVYNVSDLNKIQKGEIVLIGHIGAKKKIEVINKASEMKLPILNVKGGKNATR